LPSWLDSTGSLVWWHSPPTIIQHDLYEEAQWKLSALIPAGSFEHSRHLVTVGKAAVEIVRVAREQKADLIVLGAEGKRRLRRVFSRGVAGQVIRKAPVPMMVLYTFGRTIFPPHRIPDLPWLSDVDFDLSLRRIGERRELDEMVPW
ncbi:MAG: universal stress protein, partial [Candidatus Entotheonellia bacterium]